MSAAMKWGRAGTLRAASAGLEGSKASPLMLFQQSAELGVLRTKGSLCIAHTAMMADRHDAPQDSGGIWAPGGEHRQAPYKISATPQAHRPFTWASSERLKPPTF
jgi:hypothetical protein